MSRQNLKAVRWWMVIASWLLFFAGPALAGLITRAEIAKLSCNEYTLHVTGTADSGNVLAFEFTLDNRAGSVTTINDTITLLASGPFDEWATRPFTLAAGGTFYASGTIRVKDSAGNSLEDSPIDFGGVTPLVCPGKPSPKVTLKKFTNGHDGDNLNGVPTSGQGNFAATGTVAEIAAGDAVTWTYRVNNTGSEKLLNVRVSDNRLGAITCPRTILLVGASMDCTTIRQAEQLSMNGSSVVQGCGDGRPTYNNTGKVTAKGETSLTAVSANDPSHYCNPPVAPACPLSLTKTCEIAQPPAQDWASCRGKLASFSLIWPASAPGAVQITGIANDSGGTVQPGQRVTFSGPWSTNDLVLSITGAVTGQSFFHVSCSDRDMDGLSSTNLEQQQLPGKAQDCGKFAGNGKLGSSGVNSWLLDGLVDADGKALSCSASSTPPTSSCSFAEQDPPQCGTGGSFKPTTLTFQYTGGGCSTQSNSMAAGKTICSGAINPALPVNVSFPGGSAMNVPPGGTFTIPRTQTQSVITLTNAGGTESDSIHTSCSQPLMVGDVYFSLKLVAEDGVGSGRQVKYNYGVTNNGASTVTGISVADDKLGSIGSIASLAPGTTQTLSATTLIAQTTTNVATATASACPSPGAQATATVSVVPPPACTVKQTLYKVEDDKYKLKLTNSGNKVVKLDELVLSWPANATYGSIKDVKLDGSAYEATKSSLVVTSGVTIKASYWTQTDATKRELKPGETRNLEITFKQRWPKANCPNGSCFSGTARFAQGCEVDLAQ